MQTTIVARLAIAAALAAGAATALAQNVVTPPPRTPGMDRVRVEAGLNEDERKRYVRAHHHKTQHRKDAAQGAGASAPAGKAAAAPGQAKK